MIRDRGDGAADRLDALTDLSDSATPDGGGPVGDGGSPDAQGICSGTNGMDWSGVCRDICGAATSCDGHLSGEDADGCQAAGHPAVRDRCTASCAVEDGPDEICGPANLGDCPGDAECEGLPPDMGACDQDCTYTDPCNSAGWVRVYLDGVLVFDEPAAESLICDGMHFVAGWGCGAGPPGAQVNLLTDQPGLFEAELINFQEEHGNCEEKWCFLRLQGQCSEILLEKWNWDACNTEYYTDQMKLEIWVDQNGNCSYDGWENWEPYGGHVTWDPAHIYYVRIEYY